MILSAVAVIAFFVIDTIAPRSKAHRQDRAHAAPLICAGRCASNSMTSTVNAVNEDASHVSTAVASPSSATPDALAATGSLSVNAAASVVKISATVEDLGEMTSPNVISKRDLGLSSMINKQSLWIWGDSLWYDAKGTWLGMVSNCVSVGNFSAPSVIYDWVNPGGGLHPFVNTNAEEDADGGVSVYAFGVSRIMDLGNGEAMVFYLKNHRPGGVNNVINTGVAKVTVNPGQMPTTTRTSLTWDNTFPRMGDLAAIVSNGYVYGYGNPPWNDQSDTGVYLVRAPTAKALTDKSSYQFWNGQAWGSKPVIGPKASVFPPHTISQGQVFWSDHFNSFVFVHTDGYGGPGAYIMTSPNLEGPWSDSTKVYEDPVKDGLHYAHAGHPEYDPSGKTLLVTWTRTPNVNLMIRLTFN